MSSIRPSLDAVENGRSGLNEGFLEPSIEEDEFPTPRRALTKTFVAAARCPGGVSIDEVVPLEVDSAGRVSQISSRICCCLQYRLTRLIFAVRFLTLSGGMRLPESRYALTMRARCSFSE